MRATNEQSLTFRIGVFVLASIILLAILITLFGGSGSLFRAQDTYTIVFDYAPGVGPGTPVRRSGVRIGEVQKVALDDKTGKVRVTIRIDRPHVLYQDDQPILVQGTLTGDTTIDFVQRPAETKPAAAVPPHSQTDAAQIQPVAFRPGSDIRKEKPQASPLKLRVAQAPANQPLPANPPPPVRARQRARLRRGHPERPAPARPARPRLGCQRVNGRGRPAEQAGRHADLGP